MTIVGTAAPSGLLPRRATDWWSWWPTITDAIARAMASRGRRSPAAGLRTPVATDAPPDLDRLMLDHAEAAYRVALSVTRDHDLAEDVTQDALLKAWLALPTWRGDAPLRNWVLRITHNTAISALRKRRELISDPHEMPEVVTHGSVEGDAQHRMAMAAFETALGGLDELTRSIVVLREVESMAYGEIAELLDVPLPTVKTRLLRARRHLAAALEGWQP